MPIGVDWYSNYQRQSAPTPTPPKPGGGFAGRIGRTFVGALNLLDTAQRGVKKGVLHALPDRVVSPNFANLVGQKDISGALEATGRIQKATDLKGRARNFLIDAVLDPTNLLTLGAGTGTKIAAKGTQEALTLTKTGTKAFQEAYKGAIATSKGDLMGARLAAEKLIADKIATNPKLARQFVDKGGVKLAGKTLIPGEVSTQALGKGFKYAKDKTGITTLFNRDALIEKNLNTHRAVDLYHATIEAGKANFADEFSKVAGKIKPKEAETIALKIASGNAHELTGSSKEVADYVVKYFGKQAKELEKRGLIKGTLKDYVPIILKDPARRQALLGYINQISPKFTFGKPREAFKTLQAAKDAGFSVETDIRKIMAAYNESATQAIAKQDFLKAVAKHEGVPAKVLAGTTEPIKNAKFDFSQSPPVQAGKAQRTFTPRNQPILPGGQIPSPELVPTTKITFGKNAPDIKAQKTISESDNFVTPTLQEVPNIQRTSLTGENLVSVEGVKELEGKLIPESTAEYLRNMDRSISEAQDTKKALRIYDNVQNLYKTALTTFFPSFHARNAVSNLMQNYLDVGLLQSVNPKWHAAAVSVMRQGSPEKIVKIGGVDYTVKQLRKTMIDLGILQGKDLFDISAPITKSLTHVGRRVGRSIENEARALNFMVNLEKTGDILTAAERTKKFLFDYGNLSRFEKTTLRRAFTFYTWSKKNFLLQIEQIAKNPGKFTKYAIFNRQANEQRGETDTALLPDYLKQDLSIPLGRDDRGNIKTIQPFQTPFSSATNFINPRTQLSGLTPPLKMAGELSTGYDFFRTDRQNNLKKIKETGTGPDLAILGLLPKGGQEALGYSDRARLDESGNPTGDINYKANPYAAYFLRNNPISRFIGTGSQLTDAQVASGIKALRLTTGARVTLTNAAQQVQNQVKDYTDQLASPLVDSGLIVKGQFGYFVPKDLQMSDEERTLATDVAEKLSDKNAVTNQYLQSMGLSLDQFPSLQSTGGTGFKKLTAKELAALALATSGNIDLALKAIGKKTSSGGGRSFRVKKVSIPSPKTKKPATLKPLKVRRVKVPKIKTSKSRRQKRKFV